MTETPHLALPLIAAAQAQKHVTHNEALLAIDTLLQCAVLDKDLATPPAGPSEGDRYVVAASAAGDWVGNEDRIAVWQDGAWTYYAPQPGFIAFVVDESLLYFYGGSGWTSLASALNAVQNLSLLGLGTAADATNPFAAKLNKALWTATTAPEGGTGDLRYTLNKEAAGNVLSLLFQSGYSGRLELGLVGDDDVHLKVSADGSTWTEALRIDRATGGVDLLAAEASLAAATICDLGSSKTLKVTITGTTTITSFGTRANVLRLVCFADALALNHNATSLILPGAANIVTAAGDCAIATSDASGNWRVRGYMPATGKAVIKPASADISDATTTGKAALKAANAAALATAAGLGTANSPAFAGFSTTGVSQVRFDTGSLTDVFSIRNYGITSIGHGVCLALNIGALGGTQSYGGRLLAVASDTYATTANQTSYCQLQGILAGSIVTLMRWDPNPAASKVTSYYNFCPTTDNGLSLGIAGNRWSTVYAGTGTINTSDAREKTVVSALSEPELAAASDLAREIGTFQFLDAVAAKGADAARHHSGLTVQRAIEILTGHGLDPMRYAFICHDAWEATPEVPAVPPTDEVAAVPAVLDEEGNVVTPEVPAIPADPGRPAEPAIPAGDRYGFRPDQLAFFIARGHEARIAALEAKAAA